MGPLPHFFLMFGRVPSPFSRLQACLRGKWTFDTELQDKSTITDCSAILPNIRIPWGPCPTSSSCLGVSQVLFPACRHACAGNGLLTLIVSYQISIVSATGLLHRFLLRFRLLTDRTRNRQARRSWIAIPAENQFRVRNVLPERPNIFTATCAMPSLPVILFTTS